MGTLRLLPWLLVAVATATTAPLRAGEGDGKPAPKEAKGGKDDKPGPLPAPGVRLSVEPSSTGPWRMTLLNEGPAPVRILADVRLLWLEVVEAPRPASDSKKAPKPQPYLAGKIPLCRPPAELRPDSEIQQRAVLMRPGDRYEEDFDPMLLCGAGKLMAGLEPGAVVYPHYGYTPPPKKTKKSDDPLPPPPYVIDSLSEPRSVLPARVVDGTPLILAPTEPAEAPKDADKKDADKKDSKPELVDERAPKMVVTSTARIDAYDGTDVTVTVTLRNEGHRAALLHFRPDDVGFEVRTPAGKVIYCEQGSDKRGAVRDFFSTLGPSQKSSVSLQLHELCPTDTFWQPGVYSITADVDLRESGDTFNLPATVARATAATPTKLRVRTGRVPFYSAPPALLSPPAAPAASP